MDDQDRSAGPSNDRPAVWRVPSRYPAGALAILVLAVLSAALAQDPVERVGAACGALTLALWAVRDLAGRVRLCADAAGVGVRRGYLGWVQLVWSDIDTVSVDEYTRRGRTTRRLELEAGALLVVLSSYDLGADVREVCAALDNLRERSGS